MKKLLITQILLIVIMLSFGQDSWPHIGAKWHYSYQAFDISDPGTGSEYLYLETTKDTILNDTLCRKIEIFHYRQNGSVRKLGNEYIYSNKDSVYNYHHRHFYMMYDFSMQVGDTINLLLGTNSNIYAKLDFDVDNDSVWVKHVVTERDSIEVGGKQHLYIKYDIIYSNLENEFWFQFLSYKKIVQGMGHLGFLFGYIDAPIEADYYGPLRCYSDGEIEYTTDTPCDALTSIKLNHSAADMIVYPNPVIDAFTIDFENPSCSRVSIEIYSNEGKLIKTEYSNDDNAVISSKDLPNGLYFFKVSTESEIIGGGKFVK